MTTDQNPLFWGIEGNENMYNIADTNILFSDVELSGILGKQITPQVGVYGKLGTAFYGAGIVLGVAAPEVRAGVGYQLSDHFRITGEANYARIQSWRTIVLLMTSLLVGLQYSF